MFQAFNLQPYTRTSLPAPVVIITPEPTEIHAVVAAWAYAVRYTAKGLDLPDYEQAKHLLQERHPSWTLLESAVASVPVDLQHADNDTPE